VLQFYVSQAKFLQYFFERVVSDGEEEKKEAVVAPKREPEEPKAVKSIL
jgi:hypothetical protein